MLFCVAPPAMYWTWVCNDQGLISVDVQGLSSYDGTVSSVCPGLLSDVSHLHLCLKKVFMGSLGTYVNGKICKSK